MIQLCLFRSVYISHLSRLSQAFWSQNVYLGKSTLMKLDTLRTAPKMGPTDTFDRDPSRLKATHSSQLDCSSTVYRFRRAVPTHTDYVTM